MGSPIIFVHGIGARASDWQKFDIPGHPAFYLSFSCRFGDPAKQVPELTHFIDEVARQTKQKEVVLVCHSMGGLVARKYLVDFKNTHRVQKLILLSTPNLGSAALWFGLFYPAAWAMRPHSKFLRELNLKPMPQEVKYISVLSDAKNFIQRLLNLFLFREGGDGAVPLSSQKLSLKCAPNFSELDYCELKTNLRHFEIPQKAQAAILQAIAL